MARIEGGQGEHGCAACWPPDADAAVEALLRLDDEARVVDDSHFIVRVMACAACGQRFVSVMTEMIDWDDGDDPQHRIAIPVTPREAAAVVAGGERGIEASIAAIDRSRPSLVQSWPKGKPKETRWSRGIWIGPHD